MVADEQHGPLKDGSVLVQVPLRAVVCRSSLLQSSGKASTAAQEKLRRVWQHTQDESDLVSLWLMRARAVGALQAAGVEPVVSTTEHGPDLSDPSAWWPYIAVLPRSVNVPATWRQDKAGTGLLHDYRAAGDAERQRADLLERYSRLLPAIRELFHDFPLSRMSSAVQAWVSLESGRSLEEIKEQGYGLLPPGAEAATVVKPTPVPGLANGDGRLVDPRLDLMTGIIGSGPSAVLPNAHSSTGVTGKAWPGLGTSHDSLASFVWAATLVDSRALTIRGEKYLVPFADMLNYQPNAGAITRRADSGAAFLAYHQLDVKKQTFRVLTDRLTSVGGQVFEDYGDNDSGLYLQHHGFVPLNFTRAGVRMGQGRNSDSEYGLQGLDREKMKQFEETTGSVVKVKRVDPLAANPFDCVRMHIPSLKSGPKNSTADRRRTLAQALGLSPAMVNRSCVRPPYMQITREDGADMPFFEPNSTDTVPLALHQWLAVGLMDKDNLWSQACSKVIDGWTAAKAREAARARGEPVAEPTPSPLSASSSTSDPVDPRRKLNAWGYSLADAESCLFVGEEELPFVVSQGRANSSWLDYHIPPELKGDDGSGENRHFAAVAKDNLLSGHPAFTPKTSYARISRLARRALSSAPTTLSEDLALLSVLETVEKAESRGVPMGIIRALIGHVMQTVELPARRKYLLAQTFGRDSGFYERATNQIDAAEEEKGAEDIIDRDTARLALYYRTSRKTMLKQLVEWFEGKEKALLTEAKMHLGLLAAVPGGEAAVDVDKDSGVQGAEAVGTAGVAAAVRMAAEAPQVADASEEETATVAIGMTHLKPRDAACYFTEEEFGTVQDQCDAFNAWFDDLKPAVNKIKAVPVGGGMRLGVVTTDVLKPEQVYLAAPVDGILDSETARKDRTLGPVLSGLRKKYPNGDDFHELLMLLLLERNVRHTGAAVRTGAGLPVPATAAPAATGSTYGPYLDLLPDMDHMPFPLFYTPKELAALVGSANLRGLLEYRQSVRSKYTAIRGGVLDHYPKVFTPPHAFDLKQYRWATGILDSRSIWWGGSRHLVPLLDLINCDEGPTVSRVHATRLDPRGEYAVTRADRGYVAGEQLWENYGQPNWIYFSYHGFSMLRNSFDCVKLELDLPPSMSALAAQDIGKRKAAKGGRASKNVIEGQEKAEVGSSGEEAAPVLPSPGGPGDEAAWQGMARLLNMTYKGTGAAPAWVMQEELDDAWAGAALLSRRGKGPAMSPDSAPTTPRDASPTLSRVVGWLATMGSSEGDNPYQGTDGEVVAGQGEAEVATRAADAALWSALHTRASSSPHTRVFASQCIKADALMPLPKGGTNATTTAASVHADGSTDAAGATPSAAAAPTSDSPRWLAHQDTEDAIEWLRWGWGTDRAGALLLIRAHARSALANYPATLVSDVRALLVDLAAQMVMGLALGEDATAGVKALLQYVYGDADGYRGPSSTSLPVSLTGGLPSAQASAGGQEGAVLAPYPLGRYTLAHWQSEVMAQARESTYRGAARFARANAGLLAPRMRAITQFLVTEKVQLHALAGYDPLGRGRGRYHPLEGACGTGKGGGPGEGEKEQVLCSQVIRR